MKMVSAFVMLALIAAPAAAGSFAIYPSGWDAKDANNVGGGGVSLTWQLGKIIDLETRAAYYEQLESEPFDDFIFEGENPFVDSGLEALPIELGLRFNFDRENRVWRPYLGGGAVYYVLDSDFGSLDDEVGWYAAAGSSFGNGRGADLYAELAYRFVEGQVEDLGDIDDDGINDDFDLDLSGPVLNLGVVWTW